MFIPWLLIPAGILMVIYTDKIERFTGEIPFAEKYIGSGGTFTFLKLSGLLISILSFMWVTGGLQPLLRSLFGVFFNVPA